ncbi:hypothetical protein [Tenacibaculum finnmarkense]|uniref:hypothetical protein n=1 Tax=Tenacibaculum finnmarkense TaxID=2781243 RepID=UPI00187B8A26|nr:hypothetical protein [Tenacibaculum finnmarkense]MBE7692824.1 hypothetical protein [Tenacibaculum finnmarkense genomovar finnmarkense]
MNNIKSAFERFFRLYNKFVLQPDNDTLFNLLNAIHSLNDRLDNKSDKFFKNNEFISLKAIRNLFHHQEELINELKIIPFRDIPNATSDLLYVCLIPNNLVEIAINGIGKEYREKERKIINLTFHWYNTVVNIYPAIFNFAVSVFEKSENLNIDFDCEEYLMFKDTYDNETNNGFSHRVTGKISCGPNDVDKVIKTVFHFDDKQ